MAEDDDNTHAVHVKCLKRLMQDLAKMANRNCVYIHKEIFEVASLLKPIASNPWPQDF